MDAPDIRALAALQQTVADLERELDAYRETRRAVDAKCVEQRETIASLRAELAAMRAGARDGLREAAKLAWAFCHEAQQRLIVDDGFRAQAEVAFSFLDRALYPPGYPASSASGICWDCQVGGPVCGPCAKHAPSPASAPRETAEQSTRSTNPQSKE